MTGSAIEPALVDKYVIAAGCHRYAYKVGRLHHKYKRQHDPWWIRFLDKLSGLDDERYFAEGWAFEHAKVSGCRGC